MINDTIKNPTKLDDNNGREWKIFPIRMDNYAPYTKRQTVIDKDENFFQVKITGSKKTTIRSSADGCSTMRKLTGKDLASLVRALRNIS